MEGLMLKAPFGAGFESVTFLWSKEGIQSRRREISMDKARHLPGTISVFWLIYWEHYKIGCNNHLGHTEDSFQCQNVAQSFHSMCKRTI